MFRNLTIGRVPEAVSASYSFQNTLAGYIKQVQKHYLKTVPDKESGQCPYDLVRDYPSKGLRPGLCFATSIAFGGTSEMALPSAMTLECLHNSFHVHDDENSLTLNVGDVMNVLSLGVLSANERLLGESLSRKVFREFYHLIIETVEGQAIESGWIRENRFNIAEEDYLQMVLKKTSWYTTTHPIRIGVLIATNGSENLDRFNDFGCYLGASFQVQNDILEITGTPGGHDDGVPDHIINNRRTLMLLHLYNRLTKYEQQELQKYLLLPKDEKDPETTQKIINRMNECGSIEYAKNKAKQLSGAALKEFYSLFSFLPDSAEKRFVEDMIYYMVERNR